MQDLNHRLSMVELDVRDMRREVREVRKDTRMMPTLLSRLDLLELTLNAGTKCSTHKTTPLVVITREMVAVLLLGVMIGTMVVTRDPAGVVGAAAKLLPLARL